MNHKSLPIVTFLVATLLMFSPCLAFADLDPVASAKMKLDTTCTLAARAGGFQHTWSYGYFVLDRRERILNMTDAIGAREDMLRTGRDALQFEVQKFTKQLANIEAEAERQPTNIMLPLDITCLKSYLVFLQTVDAPSLQSAREETNDKFKEQLDQASAAAQAQQAAVDAAKEQSVLEQQETKAASAEDELKRRKQIEAEIAEQEADASAGIQEAHALPACDKDAITKAAQADFLMHTRLLITSFTNTTDDPAAPFGGTRLEPWRGCITHIVTSSFSAPMKFRIEWVDQTHKDIQITNVSYAPTL